MERRIFLLGAAATAGAAQPPASPSGSPNDAIRVAIVGLRGRGRDHIAGFLEQPRVDLAAVCDVDENLLQRRAAEIETRGRRRPAAYTDYRKLLEDSSIDAVAIATPNHHHALQTIWACQAGKDVYVEKPCSHTILEARQMVAAARRYNRVVQHGTQSRSIPVYREAVAKLRAGVIGDPYMARAIVYKWRGSIGRASPEPAPPGVHYDLWLGPAPDRPFTRNRFHYNWNWLWDFGNGDLGNQGIHELDVARWGLGVTYPTKVSTMGGHYLFDDDQETPNTMTAMWEFEEGGRKKSIVFELRHWITNGEAGMGEPIAGDAPHNLIGNLFFGCRGYLALDGQETSYRTWLGKERRPGPSRSQTGSTLDDWMYRVRRRLRTAPPRGGDHFANFLDAARARDPRRLHAPIEEGAISATLIHLANISYRLRRTVEFDPRTLSCPDVEAQNLFTKAYRPPFTLPTVA
jgi:predicted dehydrogenase